ncbi:hypothetical protein D1631_07405 [Chryseobacterium nematophagum]|uniref:DUF7674 domain-containing protein n=1 Tax=Chryseobacterium nematophagum TaxID=2305228 RepID=A0A3M7LBH2_9FLAO|nr:hypothetical protein [Chryseobacterium nematophagum]RMZ59395.1 hypothetical protein D1632_07060 [Chryseobacterium nematophagum]RNA61770.1 hypothetical protein D1631_07405 [Chryseobacterium nematophagum]
MDYLMASQEITEMIPSIQYELKDSKVQNSYNVIQIFTNHIKNMIRQNDRNILFECIKKMNYIYTNGDKMLKDAIEGIFIYSIDNYTLFCNEEYKKKIFSHISNELQKIHSRQIYSPSI